jgi:hypothetical protein
MGIIEPPREPPYAFFVEPTGLGRWNPVYDSITVLARPDNRRLLHVRVAYEVVANFELTAEEAAHLAALLSDAPAVAAPGKSVLEHGLSPPAT